MSAGDGQIGERSMKNAAGERRREALIISFAVPVLVMILIFIQRRIFPFGEESFLRTDLYHQYAPFFSEFRHKLTQGGSLLYSWDVGLGVNFSALYAYYLASPLNWLVVLWPRRYLIEFITLMIVLKTGLCGLSMTWYLQRYSRRCVRSTALFGIFYALSAYMAAYSWNVMWLDCILLFPLICAGAERLMRGGDGLLYTVALALSISSNYYISIMICLFLIFYAPALLLLRQEKLGRAARAALRFVLCSAVAGGLAAAVFLPAVFALRSTASGDFSFPRTFEAYFPILDMLARHIGNVECEIGLKHWPNIYCGTGALLLAPLYFSNSRIRLREKAVYGALLLFLLAGFSVNVLNYIWHGFHYPNSLPARQSFIYIFLVLFICFRAMDEARGNTARDLARSLCLAFGFLLFCQKFADQAYFHFAVHYAAMLLISLYAILLYLWRKRRIGKPLLLYAALVAVSVEGAVNLAVTGVPTTSRTEYTADNEAIRALRDMAPADGFFRFEKIRRKSKDDGAWLNFRSVSFFSSTAQKAMSDFLRDVGCEASVNSYSITGSTPLVDALLAVRYAFYPSPSYNRALREIGRSGDAVLYENPDVFPLAYAVPSDLEKKWGRTQENPAEVQNELCRLMEVPEVLEEAPAVAEGKRCVFVADREGEYYAFSSNAGLDRVKAELPGSTKSFDNLKRRYFMELGTLYEGDSVALENGEESSEQDAEIKIYRFNYRALRALKAKLAEHPLELRSFSDTSFGGSVSADEASVLLTSVPYDEGWSAYIDGIRVKPEPYLKAFLSVRLPAGAHELEFHYFPRGLREGALISLLSLLALSLLYAAQRRRKREAARERGRGSGSIRGAAEPQETEKACDAKKVRRAESARDAGQSRETETP